MDMTYDALVDTTFVNKIGRRARASAMRQKTLGHPTLPDARHDIPHADGGHHRARDLGARGGRLGAADLWRHHAQDVSAHPRRGAGDGDKLAQSGVLFEHMWASIEVVMLGFLISSLVAMPLGLLMGTFRIVQAALEPLVNFIRYLPVTSFVPLFILWIGIGIEQRVTVIIFGTFFQQLVMISDVVRGVSKDLLNASYTLGASRRDVVIHVLAPGLAARHPRRRCA